MFCFLPKSNYKKWKTYPCFIGEGNRLERPQLGWRPLSLHCHYRHSGFVRFHRICFFMAEFRRQEDHQSHHSCSKIQSCHSQPDSPWSHRECSYLRRYLPDWIPLKSLWEELADLKLVSSLPPRIRLGQKGLHLLGCFGPIKSHFAHLFHFWHRGQDY